MQSPEDIERAKALTLEITERQINAAILMRRDPENWALTPIQNTDRTYYRRIRNGP